MRQFSKRLERRIVRFYQLGSSSVELAKRYGCGRSCIIKIVHRHGVPTRTLLEAAQVSQFKRKTTPDPKSPTPEEIAERAAKIREGWDEDDYRKRAGLDKQKPYEFPLIVGIPY